MQHVLPRSQTELSGAPAPDQFEVNLFGPGKGECALVHLGAGEWIIIDSCVDQATKRLPALDYLARVGVRAEIAVKLVLATHAHDDHMRGIAEVYKFCTSAKFCCSSAATSEEFLALVEADEEIERELRTTVRREYAGDCPGFG